MLVIPFGRILSTECSPLSLRVGNFLFCFASVLGNVVNAMVCQTIMCTKYRKCFSYV